MNNMENKLKGGKADKMTTKDIAKKFDVSVKDIKDQIKKGKKVKIEKNVKGLLAEEESFGIKKYKTYQDFGEKIKKLRENVIKNINTLKKNNKKIGFSHFIYSFLLYRLQLLIYQQLHF